MTELLIFLLSLLGIDATPTADFIALRNQKQASIRSNTTSPIQTGKGLAGPSSSLNDVDAGGSRGGGSRQIGGPVIVFDDVMFKPVGN
jgi:hypothetical protein